MKYSIFLLLFTTIAASSLYSQLIKINEVMSSNRATISDEDGDYPDWIELFNSGLTQINLDGYHLTDNPDTLDKWQFNNLNISPGEFLLVFASDKNRQGDIYYWNSLINWGDEWKYRLGTSEPPADWNTLEFNDSNWLSGQTGIGYGDDDDNTLIEPVLSFYARKKFTIENTDQLVNLYLHIDFDDAFVAYLNGVEIARENIGSPGLPPPYDEPAISDEFEAKMYQGELPDEYIISNFQPLLIDGENLLAVQVHNLGIESSDMTFIPFLTAQLNSGLNSEQPPPVLNLPVSNIHTNFKIRSSGETLVLSEPSGGIVDSVSTGLITSDISRGRQPDGSDNWYYFGQPTPGSSNNTSGSDSIIATIAPEFSHSGGFYEAPIQLTLSTDLPEISIYYTVDGSEPTIASILYTNPIIMDNTRVIKAKTIDSFYFESETVTRTFFIDEDRPLPVFSISTEPENLWGPDGIYEDNFDREIPIYIEMYEETGDLAFEHHAGAEIFGSGSSGFEQKSLSIFFRGMYGVGELKYQLFPELPYIEYESFLLRNGGNDWWSTLIRDAMTSNGLMEGTHVDYQEYRPSIVYLNGEYWGIHNIREKVNEHYIMDHYYVSEDSLDMLQYKEVAVPEVIHGDLENYNMMIDYLHNNRISDKTNYDYITLLIDIDNFIDYQIIEIYCSNIDWPANNNKFWRPRSSNGKWRWILFDTDTGFGLWDEWWAYGLPGWEVDHVAHALNDEGGLEEGWPNPAWSTFIFRRLLNNSAFKNAFLNRFADFLNTRLSSENVLAVIEQFHASIRSALPDHLARWDRSQSNYNFELNKLKTFAQKRPEYVRQHLVDNFSLNGIKEVRFKIEPAGSGILKINTLLIHQTDWSGDYFTGIPITVSASPNAGFKLKEWTGVLESSSTFSADPKFLNEVIAVFEPDDEGTVVINEINYNSGDLKDPGDWIELYNDSSSSIDLAHWTIFDESDSNSFEIPDQTVLESGQYLIICRDSDRFRSEFLDVDKVVGDFNFGLSADDDQIRLFNNYGVLVDSVYYSGNPPWPFEANGKGPTLELVNPNEDNSLLENWSASTGFGTPGEQNSRFDIKNTGFDVKITNTPDKEIFNYPNPFIDETTIRFRVPSSNHVNIRIYDLLGREVLTLVDAVYGAGEQVIIWDGKNSHGIPLASGIYFYVYTHNYEIKAIEKMVKL